MYIFNNSHEKIKKQLKIIIPKYFDSGNQTMPKVKTDILFTK